MLVLPVGPALVVWLALRQAFSGMDFMVTNYIFYSRRTGALALVTVASGLVKPLGL